MLAAISDRDRPLWATAMYAELMALRWLDRYGHLLPAAEDASALALQASLDAMEGEGVAADDAAGLASAQAGLGETVQ
jgi:hypothetical protein